MKEIKNSLIYFFYMCSSDFTVCQHVARGLDVDHSSQFRATSLDDESAIKEKRIPASHTVKVRVASTLEHHVLYVAIDLK